MHTRASATLPYNQTIAALLLLLLLPAPLAAVDLKQVLLPDPSFDTPCDGQIRELRWRVPQTLTVRRIETWIGTTGGNPFPAVDVYTNVTAREPGRTPFTLSFFGLDHYVPFTGTHEKDKLFPPDQAPTLRAGLELVVSHMCNAVARIPAESRTQVIVSYTLD